MLITGFGETAERLRRSTVAVSAGRRGHGSGVIVGPDGVIVTNAHVATLNPVTVELWDGRVAEANRVTRDLGRDIAILRVPLSDLPAAPFADSDQLRVGELVMAVGNPLGFMGALTTGVVHAVGRVPALGAMKWIQADIRLAPGNSGGPLANARGQVVGINTMVAQGVGLAVPSNAVSRLLRREPHGRLGVITHPVDLIFRGKLCFGLLILDIIKHSAAEAASLLVGDILLAADDRKFDSIEDLERTLEGSGERVVRLAFLRGDRATVRTVAVRLGLQNTVAA